MCGSCHSLPDPYLLPLSLSSAHLFSQLPFTTQAPNHLMAHLRLTTHQCCTYAATWVYFHWPTVVLSEQQGVFTNRSVKLFLLQQQIRWLIPVFLAVQCVKVLTKIQIY